MLLCLPLLAMGAEQDTVISFLPVKKLIPSFTASGIEHRISLNKQLTRGVFIGSMGGRFPVADIHYNDMACQFSVAATVYSSLQNANVKFNVNNVDFYVDLMFDVPLTTQLTARAGWGHTSHHFADDAVGSGSIPINYARDYYELFGVYAMPSVHAFVYGGAYWTYSFLVNRNVGRKLLPEFGGEYSFATLAPGISLYGAFDLKYREEVSYASTQSYQLGIKIFDYSFRTMRLAYTVRTGIDDRGQYYDQRITIHMLGLFFDF